jgi:hypothetical protein
MSKKAPLFNSSEQNCGFPLFSSTPRNIDSKFCSRTFYLRKYLTTLFVKLALRSTMKVFPGHIDI